MALNFNKWILGGRLTKDPELNSTPNGTSVVKFSIAYNRYNGDTTFVNCQAWGKTAENISKYFKKGSSILVTGEFMDSVYEVEGQKRHSSLMNVAEFAFTGEKDDTNNSSSNSLADEFSQYESDLPY